MRVDAESAMGAEEIRVAIGESSIGLVLVALGERGVRAVMLGDDRDALRSELRERFPNATLIAGDAKLDALVAKVVDLIEAPRDVGLNVPLDMCGSEFQLEVWQALREIPAGKTASYADIAHKIGRPNAVRAVGAACAANHLAVVVPCHRAVRSDGQLAGYRWGVERKRTLLDREAVA